MTNPIAVQSHPRASILARMADRFSIEPRRLLDTLKATAFKGPVTDEQMIALLIVADQYGLNPFTRELWAFPDKGGGVVPVVSVDGWARIINGHPQFDGMTFEIAEDGSACTATIWRRDRSHPVVVTEYLRECRRDTAPWKSHPLRMLRHKSMIQAARLAFGYSGVYDPDEAERVRDMGMADEVPPRTEQRLEAIRSATSSPPAAPVVDAATGELEHVTPAADVPAEPPSQSEEPGP